jgi:hypothetical protein
MSEQSTAPAPAQAPAAPSAPVLPTMPGRGFDAVIKSVAAKTTIPAPVAVETPRVVIQRSESPRPDAPGSRDAVPDSGPTLQETIARMSGGAPEASATDDSAGDEPAPIGEPSNELSIDDGEVTLAAQRNADGTFKSKLDPNEKVDLVIKSIIDPETGKPKVYSKSLPELARLAKDGITLQPINQKLTADLKTIQPEVEYYRKQLPEWQKSEQTLRQELEEQKALNIELLTADDELVITRREMYQSEMTPEKQLARLKAEREAEVAQRTTAERQQKHAKIATSFMESRIAPALSAAEAVVGPMAVTGAVTHYTNDLMVNGVIPPANWPEMERRINAPDGPFQTWLKAESAKRTHESDTVKQAREAAEAPRTSSRASRRQRNRAGHGPHRSRGHRERTSDPEANHRSGCNRSHGQSSAP